MKPIPPGHPQHGVIKTGGDNAMDENYMRQHLAQHEAHMNRTADYGGHGVGDTSRGAPTSTGPTNYQTTSVGAQPDCDTGGNMG